MIYHVLPGDAQVEDFRKTGIPGELIVFREAFVTGPIDAVDVNEFWDQRAHFVLSEYAEDEISYHEKVADEILRISEIGPDDEVNLWFEFELFCSVNFWYCLSELKDSGATVYRVGPFNLEPDDVWKGFGGRGSDELAAAYESRTEIIQADLDRGAELWTAFRRREGSTLRKLSDYRSASMPFLKEVAEAGSEIDSASRLSAAPLSVGQSERLPMMMATGALAPMKRSPWPDGEPSRKGGEYRRQCCDGNLVAAIQKFAHASGMRRANF